MQALSVEVEVSNNPNFLMKVLRRGDDEARYKVVTIGRMSLDEKLTEVFKCKEKRLILKKKILSLWLNQ